MGVLLKKDETSEVSIDCFPVVVRPWDKAGYEKTEYPRFVEPGFLRVGIE